MVEHFFKVLYQMIFEEEAPCMSHEAMKIVTKVANWFASLDGTYLKVFDCQKPPHILLRYVTDKVIMQEISYHRITCLFSVL